MTGWTCAALCRSHLLPETCHRILFVRRLMRLLRWGMETKPRSLPPRDQYHSEKLQLVFGIHSLALPSSCTINVPWKCRHGSHVQLQTSWLAGLSPPDIHCFVQGTDSFCKGLVWPLDSSWLISSLESHSTAGSSSSVAHAATRSMFSYLLDPGTIAKARAPCDVYGDVSLVWWQPAECHVPSCCCKKKSELITILTIARCFQYTAWSESNQCGVIMLLHSIMLYIAHCIRSSCLSMFIRLFLSCCI